MNVTFEELRRIKHALPPGGVAQLAREFRQSEEAIRNYFGAGHYKNGEINEFHIESGYGGGVVHLEDTAIFDRAVCLVEDGKATVS